MEEEKKKKTKTAIYFNTSLKHDKDGNKINIETILNDTKGYYDIYCITHKTNNEEEEHTHFWIKAKTPRRIENIANLFNVEKNFINYTKSPRAQLRYLTHMDNPEKEQYLPEEVITNSKITYYEMINKENISKKEILQEMLNKKDLYLICMEYIEFVNTNELYAIYRIANEIKKHKQFKEKAEEDYINTINELMTENIKLKEKLKEKK